MAIHQEKNLIQHNLFLEKHQKQRTLCDGRQFTSVDSYELSIDVHIMSYEKKLLLSIVLVV